MCVRFRTELAMFIKTLIAVWILFVRCDGIYMCSSVSPCPQHKSYCTPVGCVFECPVEFFINGSTCVPTCGDWFTYDDRRCLPTCSDNYLIREVVKLIGLDSYLEKQCVSACKNGEYIFNGTCVQACPADFNCIREKSCLEKCPDNHEAKQNFTKGGLLYHNCLGICPVVEENGYCTNECSSENKVIFSSLNKCLEDCPISHPSLYLGKCYSKCPHGSKGVNNICKWNCPEDMPYIFRNSCVEKCPDKFNTVHTIAYNGDKKCVNVCEEYLYGNQCVSVCPGSTVMYNGSCQPECPDTAPFICDAPCDEATYQGDMCVEKCPLNRHLNNIKCVPTCPFVNYKQTCFCLENMPFLNNKTEGTDCSTYRSGTACLSVKWHLECLDSCTENKFLFQKYNTCVDICPDDTVLLNRTCVDTCTEDSPFIENKMLTIRKWMEDKRYYYPYRINHSEKNVRHCVKKCKDSNVYLNFTCVGVCPGKNDFALITQDTEQYYLFNRTCVRICPESHPLIGNSTHFDHCYDGNKRCHYMKWYLECMTDCPENTYSYQNRCVSFCPPQLFTYKNTCVSSCPSTSKITRKLKVRYWQDAVLETNYWYMDEGNISVNECVSSCYESLFFDGKCIDACPLHYKYVTNGTCHNDTCGTKYTHLTTLGTECLDQCLSGTFLHENACVSSCPTALISGSVCVEVCPELNPYIYPQEVVTRKWSHSKSVDWTANVTTEINHICCRRCPDDKFALDREKKLCVKKCPEHSKYIHNGKCVTFCPEYTYYPKSEKETHCLYKCNKGMFAGENRTCVSRCPDHLRFTSDSVCVTECPSARPFALDTNECIYECEDSDYVYYADERSCISEYSCDKPYFVFARQCLQECPSGYKWFISCYYWYVPIIGLSVLTVLIIIYITYCRLLFQELFEFLRLCQVHAKSYDDGKFTSAVLNVLELDAVKVEGNIRMDDIDITETNLFRMFHNNCYIHDDEDRTEL